MLHLSNMHMFRSIGNHFHIRIVRKKHLHDMLPLNHTSENCQACVRGLIHYKQVESTPSYME